MPVEELERLARVLALVMAAERLNKPDGPICGLGVKVVAVILHERERARDVWKLLHRGGDTDPASVQELPLTATLDDGDNLMPTAKLSALQEVELVARLSASGDATKAEGDIESAPVRVKLPASGPIELVIGTP